MPTIIPPTHHYSTTQGDEFPEYTQIEGVELQIIAFDGTLYAVACC